MSGFPRSEIGSQCPARIQRIIGALIALGSLSVVAQVVPSRRGRPHDGEARWDVLEFLARVVDHVPEPSQQMVRYWGFYANAARGKRRKAALVEDTTQTPSRQDEDEFTRRACPSWAK